MPIGGARHPDLAGHVHGDADDGGGGAPVRAQQGVRGGDGGVGEEGEL